MYLRCDNVGLVLSQCCKHTYSCHSPLIQVTVAVNILTQLSDILMLKAHTDTETWLNVEIKLSLFVSVSCISPRRALKALKTVFFSF